MMLERGHGTALSFLRKPVADCSLLAMASIQFQAATPLEIPPRWNFRQPATMHRPEEATISLLTGSLSNLVLWKQCKQDNQKETEKE